MSLAFADRDFYYGDIYFPPEEPIAGLLSKDYAKERAKLINPDHNDPTIKPGDPYPYQTHDESVPDLLERDGRRLVPSDEADARPQPNEFLQDTVDSERFPMRLLRRHHLGRSSRRRRVGGIRHAERRLGAGRDRRPHRRRAEPADAELRHRSRRRARSTSSSRASIRASRSRRRSRSRTASRSSCFSVQGGDSQDQNLLQFFLNVVEFGMNVQQATEAPNINSFQMRSSFGEHEIRPGRILLSRPTPQGVRGELTNMGYTLTFEDRTSGPINAILIDRAARHDVGRIDQPRRGLRHRVVAKNPDCPRMSRV